MCDAARPGLGTGDSRDLGSPVVPSRGAKIPRQEKNSPLAGRLEGFAAGPGTFGNSNHGGRAKQRQIKSPANAPAKAGVRMTSFLRKPEAALWVLSISQAAAMLAFSVLLRAVVS